MRTARWEIYDKVRLSRSFIGYECEYLTNHTPQYLESPGFGLLYQPQATAWMDNATEWLDDKRSSEELRGHLRNKCPAGIAYNDLLQENPTGFSVQRPESHTGSLLPHVLPTPEPSQ